MPLQNGAAEKAIVDSSAGTSWIFLTDGSTQHHLATA
jgi:hypothetical protein